LTAVSAGRIGKPHGRDGSFWLDAAAEHLSEGVEVEVAGARARVLRSDGTDDRPLLRLSGIEDREAAAVLRGAEVLVEMSLEEDEWLAGDLVGCSVAGLGKVSRVVAGPTCDLLELDDGTLVPLVGDAVRRVDTEAQVIEVDRGFLGQ
jgi:16S rRNA processing protein RimM